MDQDPLAQTLRIARYNEIVEVNVEDKNIYLTATIDLENGGIQWQPIDPNQLLSRHLRAKRWFFPMLNDEARNRKYQQAINGAVETMERMRGAVRVDESSAKTRVLDIGTGTGLLSMMVARKLKNSQIYSLEMSSSMAEIARQTIKDNDGRIGEHNEVSVLAEHSTEFRLPQGQRAHLCVSELLESGLLGEGLLVSLRDAWDRLLEPDAIMIPQRARVFVAAVQGAWIQELFGPISREVHDPDTRISFSLDQQPEVSSVMIKADQVVFPVHAQHVFGRGIDDGRILTESRQGFNISLDRESLLSGRPPEDSKVTLKCTHAGYIHGFLIWWELDLWEGITYSLAPGAEPWQDHWHDCVHPASKGLQVQVGDTVTVRMFQDGTRVNVSLFGDECGESDSKRPRRADPAGTSSSPLISPERAMQLNDYERMEFYKEGIRAALSVKGKDARLLDLSDFSFCACIAAVMCGATQVWSVESSPGDLPMISARMCQLGNSLPRSESRFEILQCHAEQLTLEVLGGQPIDVVVAEPYYQVLEGWHMQEALNYYCLIRALRSRRIIAADAMSVPGTCHVMACAIESYQLRSAYRRCGEPKTSQSICGFDHSCVNELGADFESHDLDLPIWQYEYDCLSDKVELICLDFSRPGNDPVRSIVPLTMTKDGVLDAVLIWVEYSWQGYVKVSPLSTMSKRGYRQTIRMMKEPTVVDTAKALLITSSFLAGPDEDGFALELQ